MFLLGANVLAGVQPAGALSQAPSLASDISLMRGGTASGTASRSASQGQEASSAHRRSASEAGSASAAAGAAGEPQHQLAGAAAPTPLSPQQARQDAELEVAVLDCLADAVLTQCAAAPAAMKQRLIETVDRGAVRPRELSVPQVRGALREGRQPAAAPQPTCCSCADPLPPCPRPRPQATTSSNFGHVCIRKMYVLCSRGGSLGAADPDGCLLEVSRLALPVFMARCDGVLRAYAEDQARALMAAGGQSAARCGGRPLGWGELACRCACAQGGSWQPLRTS